MEISDEQFAALIDEAFEHLPAAHRRAVKNVAIVYADEPTPGQREQLRLQCNQTLYGLYEGVPLARRQGITSYPPDKITIFKLPLLRASGNEPELREHIRHTVWHEVAHYFGLNHEQIHRLEQR
ncbi:MAG TPA: metallopeptidase family protein [Candidatus Saccharimonadales bacterium]|nr:metallopeptidase family protein [Candidatus Saccharimonadales bacterium]